MHTISVTQLYEQLTDGVGKETAENLCSYINGKIKEELEDQTKILATKKDVTDLRLDIESLRQATKKDTTDLKLDIENLRLKTELNTANFRQEVREESSEFRQEVQQEFAKSRLEAEQLRLEVQRGFGLLLVKVTDNKAETIKWMFIFWIGQATVLLGLLLAILRR